MSGMKDMMALLFWMDNRSVRRYEDYILDKRDLSKEKRAILEHIGTFELTPVFQAAVPSPSPKKPDPDH